MWEQRIWWNLWRGNYDVEIVNLIVIQYSLPKVLNGYVKTLFTLMENVCGQQHKIKGSL